MGPGCALLIVMLSWAAGRRLDESESAPPSLRRLDESYESESAAPSYAPTPVSFAPTHFALGPWSSVATEHGCDCREFATSECKGACSHCGFSRDIAGPLPSDRCIPGACDEGLELDVKYTDCSGRCVANGTAAHPLEHTVAIGKCTLVCSPFCDHDLRPVDDDGEGVVDDGDARARADALCLVSEDQAPALCGRMPIWLFMFSLFGSCLCCCAFIVVPFYLVMRRRSTDHTRRRGRMQTHVVLGRDADCSTSAVAPVVATAMNAPADVDGGVATAAARAYPAEPGRECVPISTAVCVVAQAAPDDDGGGADPEARVDAPTARPVLTARPC